MGANSNQNTGKSVFMVLVGILIGILLVIAGFFIWNKFAGFNEIQHETESIKAEVETETTDIETEDSYNFTFEELANDQIHNGELILVNSYYEYTGDSSDITRIFDEKNEYYSVSSYEDSARPIVISEFNRMMKDFYSAKSIDDVNIISAFRTRELQQSLYDAGNADYVARPGFSEHESGYAIDLGIYNNEGSFEFDATGDYSWIKSNCYKYGFILRYPLDKENVTMIKYEPWHYRYVGFPHAYYMYQNKLCFEEYITLLRRYPFNGEHLIVTDFDKTQYEIYYVSTESDTLTTQIPVPENMEYTISGDNINGFIVTVKIK